jgi:hypothetical protein
VWVQHWYKDMRHSTRVKDAEGHPAFALVNRATGLAVKHSLGQSHPVKLVPYNADYLDESVLWTESNDVGKGFRCIRMVNNIHLNFDALHGDKDHGGVHDGTGVVLWEWCKGDNQSWKVLPWGTGGDAYGPPQQAYGGSGYGYGGGSSGGQDPYAPPPPAYGGGGYAPPPAPYGGGGYAPPPLPNAHGAEAYAPPGAGYGYGNLHPSLASEKTVRVFCRAGEDYSLTVRNGAVCLAPTNPRDEFQVILRMQNESIVDCLFYSELLHHSISSYYYLILERRFFEHCLSYPSYLYHTLVGQWLRFFCLYLKHLVHDF